MCPTVRHSGFTIQWLDLDFWPLFLTFYTAPTPTPAQTQSRKERNTCWRTRRRQQADSIFPESTKCSHHLAEMITSAWIDTRVVSRRDTSVSSRHNGAVTDKYRQVRGAEKHQNNRKNGVFTLRRRLYSTSARSWRYFVTSQKLSKLSNGAMPATHV